jgi:hypothetical protein
MSACIRFPWLRRLQLLAAAGFAFASLALHAATARADVQIGFDLDYALPIDSSADGGGGFALRLGQQIHVPAIAFTPEIVFAYHSYAGGGDPATYRGVGGARLGFGEIFRLGPFAHIGLGHIDLDLPGDPSDTSFTYDLGLFFDLTLLPLLNLGVHGSYNELRNNDLPTFQWAIFGAHAELIF